MSKARVKLAAAVTAGAAGATAGPMGAFAAVAASQFLVEGAYSAYDTITRREQDPETEPLTEEPELKVGEAIATHKDGSKTHHDLNTGNVREIREAQ